MDKGLEIRSAAERDGSKPGHEIFNMPENKVFLATKPYKDMTPH
jgi:hypothetical protein